MSFFLFLAHTTFRRTNSLISLLPPTIVTFDLSIKRKRGRERGRKRKREGGRTRTPSADNTERARGVAFVCALLQRRRRPPESRIRYRSISPGTGSGALLRFLYFIPPGSGPIKSALQYACRRGGERQNRGRRGNRLAFRTWPRAHARVS